MLTIKIPGSVWDDFLDPAASEMQAELGLPRPERRRAGKGWTAIYADVPVETARELARYLYDRGDTLLGQGIVDPYDPFEKASRDTLRRAIKAAARINEAIAASARPPDRLDS